ncbi:Fluconazole resistance protein 3 [Venturia nashicola]|uniref:Fluconazole resistance protein 3 n=1 Tax=Venturia nashicola TaxID=86259 RepID=A0A4Z1PQW2_9PEZI|nr:Fluconazole resistance protein 3 [Venturia nashicola]TLD37562.1 Fluconazole resistance protein 3 [Venturia nashicola]
MAQRDYSRHYQASQSPDSPYERPFSQQQYLQSTSTPQYDSAMGQGIYHTDPYDPTGQCSGDQGRSMSQEAGSSKSDKSRRREQNRLAQRALRQRRETHVRELEHQVLHRSLETRHLATENRQLSHHLTTVEQQNELLRHQQMGNAQSAEAWAAAASYSPYAQQAPSPYNESAAFYHSPHSSTSDPTPMRTQGWDYSGAVDPIMYDHAQPWTGHAYAQTGGYGGQYEEDDDEEEEQEQQPRSKVRRRRG